MGDVNCDGCLGSTTSELAVTVNGRRGHPQCVRDLMPVQIIGEEKIEPKVSHVLGMVLIVLMVVSFILGAADQAQCHFKTYGRYVFIPLTASICLGSLMNTKVEHE